MVTKLLLIGGEKMKNKTQRFISLCALVIGCIILFLMFAPVSNAQDRLNLTIAKLKAGQPVFGIISMNRDMWNARALGSSKLDYIIYDVEHLLPFDMENFSLNPVIR